MPPTPPHVFQGPIGAIEGYPEDGRNAWRASNDDAIVAAVNRHNAERNLYPGDAEFMTPKLMKSWMMEEGGGHRAAFERDPLQEIGSIRVPTRKECWACGRGKS